MTEFFNRTSEKSKRQDLRNDATSAEKLLWSKLKGKQLLGVKFRRQYSVGPYILDLYCPSCRLAIELDGESHLIGMRPPTTPSARITFDGLKSRS